MSKISVIVPCYYNEENIPVTGQKLIDNEKLFPDNTLFEYIFVDDGSGDQTLKELYLFKNKHSSKVKVIKLAGNVGSYNAVVAGMENATGDCTIIISADLQDPIEMMPVMYKHWLDGIKLVIGSRLDRNESWLQKAISNTFHNLMRRFALQNVPQGGFDYVLFDKEIRERIVEMQERNTNIFYLMAWMGYTYVNIPYIRKERELGVSRWTLSKKIKLFIDSFVSFSYIPLRMISILGITLGLGAFFYGIYVILAKILGFVDIEGWTALMVVVLFVSSFQMIALGIIGEYVWRGLDASRKRPLYIIEKERSNSKSRAPMQKIERIENV
jgi:polyisoprenyl-phosphate glycosyltransferase